MGKVKTNSAPKKNVEPEYVPRTDLGRRLLAIRKRIVASGKTRPLKQILDELHAQRSAR